MLKRLQEMVDLLEKQQGTLNKKHTLKKYKDLKPLLKLIYDPRFIFNITGDAVQNFISEVVFSTWENWDIIKVLHDLNKRRFTGNEALEICEEFVSQNEVYAELIYKLLNKDLKCGISYKTINSVFPGLIPEFNVSKATDYKEGYCDFKKDTWKASRKRDGVRCLIFIHSRKNIECFSRNGIKFNTLGKIEETIKSEYLGEFGVILDGEICIIDDNGNESFKNIMKEIRRKNHTIQNPTFCLFDQFTIEDFLKGEITRDQEDIFVDFTKGAGDHIEFIEQINIKDENHLQELVLSRPNEWEGHVLKKWPTVFKRSKSFLRSKMYEDLELKVHSILVSEKNINGVPMECVGSLLCYYKGNPLNVGSGITDEERIEWLEESRKIIGKNISIKHSGESKDKKGKLSLRHPRFKGIRIE